MKTIPAPGRLILRSIGERLSGSKPGVFRALLRSIAVGAAASVVTYKLQRSGD